MNKIAILEALQRLVLTGLVTVKSTMIDSTSDAFTSMRAFRGKNPERYNDYVNAFKNDPSLRFLESVMVPSGPLGACRTLSIDTLAQHFLNKTIEKFEPEAAIDELQLALSAPVAHGYLVLSILGATVSSPVSLTDEIELIPISLLPPSMGRGASLGETVRGDRVFPPRACSVALRARLSFSPAFIPNDDVNEVQRIQREEQEDLLSRMRELANCLAICGQTSIQPHTAWLHFENEWDFLSRLSGYINYDVTSKASHSKELNSDHIKRICRAFAEIPEKQRERALRIPLDRLNRAIQQKVLVDQVIDLGIALEALLLHDLDNNTELGYRLATRGAWLHSSNVEVRKQTFKQLQKLYALRSQAVHKGMISGKAAKDARLELTKGIELCSELIEKVIELGAASVDWQSKALGGDL